MKITLGKILAVGALALCFNALNNELGRIPDVLKANGIAVTSPGNPAQPK